MDYHGLYTCDHMYRVKSGEESYEKRKEELRYSLSEASRTTEHSVKRTEGGRSYYEWEPTYFMASMPDISRILTPPQTELRSCSSEVFDLCRMRSLSFILGGGAEPIRASGLYE